MGLALDCHLAGFVSEFGHRGCLLSIDLFDLLAPHGSLEDGLDFLQEDAVGSLDFGIPIFLDAVHFLHGLAQVHAG